MKSILKLIVSVLSKQFVAISFFFIITCLIPVQAAEILLPKTGNMGRPLNHSVLIEGQIVKGDFNRFQYLALTYSADTVWLASPGGDLAEAIKIGQFVRRLKMSVWAPESNKEVWNTMINISNSKDNVCASACFFIYAAGVHRAGEVLGIHRPRITEEELKAMTMEQAAGEHTSVIEIASNYLQKMGVPNSIIEKASTTRPNEIQWLTNSEVKLLSGYIPEYQDWVDAQCESVSYKLPDDPNPCKNCSTDELIKHWEMRVETALFKCKSDLIETAQIKARQDLLDEYVKSGQIQELIDEQKHEHNKQKR